MLLFMISSYRLNSTGTNGIILLVPLPLLINLVSLSFVKNSISVSHLIVVKILAYPILCSQNSIYWYLQLF